MQGNRESSQTTMHKSDMNNMQAGKEIKTDPAYDVMKNLPELKGNSGIRKSGKMPDEPLQSEACCRCSIF